MEIRHLFPNFSAVSIESHGAVLLEWCTLQQESDAAGGRPRIDGCDWSLQCFRSLEYFDHTEWQHMATDGLPGSHLALLQHDSDGDRLDAER